MNDNSKTIACVRSEKEGIIYLHVFPDSEKPNEDVFQHCKILASQHEGADWFVADASRYNVNVEPNY